METFSFLTGRYSEVEDLVLTERLCQHNWAQSCLTSSSATWMKSWNVPSASLLMTPNWEVWQIHQKAVLPFSETWIGWKVGQRGT